MKIVDRQPWRSDAACIGTDTEVFFGGHSPKARAQAIKLCTSCPVRADCLESALDEEISLGRAEVTGIRGGLTAMERFKINTERRHDARAQAGLEPRGRRRRVGNMCGNGSHEMTTENSSVSKDGVARCRECQREYRERRRLAEKARRYAVA